MSYAGSGSGNTQTPDERKAEAGRILTIMSSLMGAVTAKEYKFLLEMEDADNVSPKQLWWLRDIKAKYAE